MPSARELFWWLLGGFAMAIVMTWPLVAHLPTHVPQDAADPLAEAWEVAWGGHALRTQPLDLFRANAFWPEAPSLAFSDSLLGYAPLAVVGSGVTAAIVRYNLLFLFAYALAFAGAAYLARAVAVRPLAAAVAGVAFAYAPWRLAHNGHLNVLSIGGIPLALALLLVGYLHRRPKRIVAGWMVAAWQVSLGFGMGIYFCYLLLVLGAVTVVACLWRGQVRPTAPVVGASVVGAGLFALVTLGMVTPYLGVLDTYPEAARDRGWVEFYSPPPAGLLAAPPESRVWGEATKQFRRTLPWPPEQALFPGLTVVALAVAGAFSKPFPRALRGGLVAGSVIAGVLSLGLRLKDGRFTYGPLLDHAPGFEGLRTPGRLTMFTSLGLALLAAIGTQRLARYLVARRRTGRYQQASALSGAAAAATVAMVLVGLVTVEGSARLPLAEVPAAPRGLVGLPEPQYHLPAGVFPDMRYMLWSAGSGFPKMGNGNTSFLPAALQQLRDQSRAFPDRATVELLRATGYRVVVLHLDWVRGTPWEQAATRSIDSLGVTREIRGDVMVFDLRPPKINRR